MQTSQPLTTTSNDNGEARQRADGVEQMDQQERSLREFWTARGVSVARQDELIAGICAKSAPGARVGPVLIKR